MYPSDTALWWQANIPLFQVAEDGTVELGEALRRWDAGLVEADGIDRYWTWLLGVYGAIEESIANRPFDSAGNVLNTPLRLYQEGIAWLRRAHEYWRRGYLGDLDVYMDESTDEEFDRAYLGEMNSAWDQSMTAFDRATDSVQQVVRYIR